MSFSDDDTEYFWPFALIIARASRPIARLPDVVSCKLHRRSWRTGLTGRRTRRINYLRVVCFFEKERWIKDRVSRLLEELAQLVSSSCRIHLDGISKILKTSISARCFLIKKVFSSHLKNRESNVDLFHGFSNGWWFYFPAVCRKVYRLYQRILI